MNKHNIFTVLLSAVSFIGAAAVPACLDVAESVKCSDELGCPRKFQML